MKKNKILLIAAVACTSMFSSCSDLLDLYPEDSLSDPKFWTSVQDLELYANGFYGILPGAQGPVPMVNRTLRERETEDLDLQS